MLEPWIKGKPVGTGVFGGSICRPTDNSTSGSCAPNWWMAKEGGHSCPPTPELRGTGMSLLLIPTPAQFSDHSRGPVTAAGQFAGVVSTEVRGVGTTPLAEPDGAAGGAFHIEQSAHQPADFLPRDEHVVLAITDDPAHEIAQPRRDAQKSARAQWMAWPMTATSSR